MLFRLLTPDAWAQDHIASEYGFIIDKQLHTTPVKDQAASGTCWSFAAISFIETELLRKGHGYYDFSEMYMLRNTYLEKADRYVRMHGNINFGSGGEANDVTASIKSVGIMPDSVYPGSHFSIEDLNFHEMDRALKDFVDGVIRSTDDRLDLAWKKEFESLLDSYLGPVPEMFIWGGEEYTPLSFADSLGLNMDDYILIGSYMHHPFYEKFILEVPDNWSWEYVYNIPLDELVDIVNQSVLKGYTVVWATDISEEGFSFIEGLAQIRENYRTGEIKTFSAEKSVNLTEETGSVVVQTKSFLENGSITQEKRQTGFDNYETQDDHAMHIIGIAHDAEANRYYYVKNSWGMDNPFNGYLFVSEDYFRYKTISIMINKNALDKEKLVRLKLK